MEQYKTNKPLLSDEAATHVFGVFQEPSFGRLGVGDGLLGGESLSVTQ